MTKLENKNHVAQVVALLNTGEVLMIGEYRGTRIDEREFKDKENPAVKVNRVIVTHSFESATGEQMPCQEFTPPGTRREDIKVTMQVGEKHVCIVGGLKYNGNIRSVTVRRFEHLSGLLT
jgi:hypothetical protein